MIAAVIHTNSMQESPHPCASPPLRRNGADDAVFPILRDRYCPVCIPRISRRNSGGKPSRATHSCTVMYGTLS